MTYGGDTLPLLLIGAGDVASQDVFLVGRF
jgi:hypothetical protein